MTQLSVPVLRASLAQIEPAALDVARAFYTRLFARHPDVRALFRGDLEAQGVRLMAMIAAGVRLLDRPQELQSALHRLGQRHQGYGVREEHYPAVGSALLDTLAEHLGDEFTPEVREAWSGFYTQVSALMLAGTATLPEAARA